MAVFENCNLALKLILRRFVVVRGYKTVERANFNEEGDFRRRDGGYSGRREGDLYGERRERKMYDGGRDSGRVRGVSRGTCGVINEDAWSHRKERMLEAVSSQTGAKICEQPVSVECGELQYNSWSKFSEIESLDTRLKEVITNMSHDEMSPIQKHTFDILNRHLIDILGSAETGSGKTLAFLLPILNNILSTYPKTMMEELKTTYIQTPLMLVLAPTRELVQQIYQEARKVAQLTPLCIRNVIGGVNINTQMASIDDGCHSLIATPGRLIDLLSRGSISLKHCNNVVLDEADRMLDMGFEPQIRQIISEFDLPKVSVRQTSMFSATFPNDVMTLARSLLNKSYGRILVGNNAGSRDPSVPESIAQSFTLCDQSSMLLELFKLLQSSSKKTIVFCNTKRDVETIERFSRNRQLKVATLFGDLSQRARSEELYSFKSNKVQVLVATSVAARGIDVTDVECVINYGVPTSSDEYVHRVGRCGRMGRPGVALTLVTKSQLQVGSIVKDLVNVLKKTGQIIPEFFSGINAGAPVIYKSKQDFRSYNRAPRSDFNRYKPNFGRNHEDFE